MPRARTGAAALAAIAALCMIAGAAGQQSKIPGCADYSADGSCARCERPAYRLARGTCACANGYESSTDDGQTTCKPGPCYNHCGQAYLKAADGSSCSCDYWCNNHGDCCGGAASKDALCPNLAPTLNKTVITDCDGTANAAVTLRRRRRNASAPGAARPRRIYARSTHESTYMPGMCWCDEFCAAAGDCCPACSDCQAVGIAAAAPPVGADAAAVAVAVAAVAADSATPLAKQLESEVAVAARGADGKVHDCSAHAPYPSAALAAKGSVAIAAAPDTELQAETMMQACQAADEGPPEEPIVIPVFWTAGQVCRSGSCTGGRYGAAVVREQMAYINRLFAHAGIQFTWDGEIHTATASDPNDIEVCQDMSGNCWSCRQRRYGGQLAINVMTAPTHISGGALGVTMYPSYFATGEVPMCANWAYIFEKTLPGLGGRSMVDNGLADSGATLAHEIGHQLMLHHTWFEEYSNPSTSVQCEGSASMDPRDIIRGRSDGVRDTPAQSRNGTNNPVTDILRFVNCDAKTGAYANTTAFAQQSCTSARGFPQGDSYYNNYNNLMSYGDRTCLRTITPGQGARARCAIKCMWLKQC